MASRRTVQFRNSLEPGLTDIVAVIAYAASGNTYTLQQWQQGNFGSTTKYVNAPTGGYGGVKSVTRTSTGLLSIQFGSGSTLMPTDAYRRVVDVYCTTQTATTGLPTVIACGITPGTNNTGLDSTGTTVAVGLASSTATAADPADGTVLVLHFVLQNSAASLV